MSKREPQISAKIYQFQPRGDRGSAAVRSTGKALQPRQDERHFVDFTACYHDAAIEQERAAKA